MTARLSDGAILASDGGGGCDCINEGRGSCKAEVGGCGCAECIEVLPEVELTCLLMPELVISIRGWAPNSCSDDNEVPLFGEHVRQSEGLLLDPPPGRDGGEGEEGEDAGWCSLAVGTGQVEAVGVVMWLPAVVVTVVVVALEVLTTVTKSCLLTDGELRFPVDETGTLGTAEFVIGVGLVDEGTPGIT